MTRKVRQGLQIAAAVIAAALLVAAMMMVGCDLAPELLS